MKINNRGISLIVIFGLLSHFGFTQGINKYKIDALGASGITLGNNQLFVVQERNRKIIRLNTEGEILDSSINIPLYRNGTDNEGICFFNSSLWTVLEDSGKIMNFSMKGNLINSWIPSKIVPYNGGYGYESITVDSTNKKLYIGHERIKKENKYISTIHTFTIDSTNNLVDDSVNYKIELNDGFRMTDFTYNAIDNCFYCILSRYNNRDTSRSKYLISKRKIIDNNFLEVDSYDITPLMMCVKSEGFNNNIEGITFDKEENLFLTTDNFWKKKDNKTLLLSMKKSDLLNLHISKNN